MQVLCLHGGGSNSNIMRVQVAQLKTALGEAEWHFLDGPRPWSFESGCGPDPLTEALADDMPFLGWYDIGFSEGATGTHAQKFLDPGVVVTYSNVEPGLEFLLEHLRSRGPFDVLVAFSQGCVMAHLAADALRASGEAPWRVSVLVGGLSPQDRRFAERFEAPLAEPAALLVQGRQDPIRALGEDQARLYRTAVCLEHDDGHQFPSARQSDIYAKLAEEIRRQCSH